MYKILNTRGLGVGGRQNELIELALTHKFNGVEIDMEDLLGRHDTLGKEFACQFLKSAKTDMGTFRLPIHFGASDEAFNKALGKVETILDLANELGAKRCFVEVETHSPTDSFQENFDNHQTRLQQLAEIFAVQDIKIGLSLQATKGGDVEGQFKFIQTAEEMQKLVKSIGHKHVGVCLDMFEWQIGGGTVDQVKALLADGAITEVRLADLTAGVAAADATETDRAALLAAEVNSPSYQVTQLLTAAGYDGTVSASTNSSTYNAEGGRDKICATLSQLLDQLIEGLDPAVVAAEAIAEAEAAAAEEAGEEGEAKPAEAKPAEGEAAPTAAAAPAAN